MGDNVDQQATSHDLRAGSKLLELEYAHATQNLFDIEANRNRLAQSYLIVTGIVVTISQIPGILPQAVAGLAFLAFVFGLVTVVALARCRMNTIASYQAQTLIRQYYIRHHPTLFREDLRNALLWDEPSVPQKESLASYNFLSSFSVMLMNSAVLGVAVYEWLQSFEIAAGTLGVACGIQVWMYLLVLNHEFARSEQTERFQEKVNALRK